MIFDKSALDYIDAHQEEARELLIRLCQIPAPSNHEELRAEFCKNWFLQHGAADAFVDEALNVIVPIGCRENGPLMVFSAHIDTVFPDRDKLPLEVRGGRIYCPGVGDDTANVVALMYACRYLTENRLSSPDCGILIVLVSGEEGLGNLKGTRRLMETYGARIRQFVSFDSFNGTINDVCVGSKRFRVEITTEGGHSFEKFGNRNAIRYMAALIDTLYAVKVPEEGKTTFNVGLIQGGTSVNTIAQSAEMLYEIRSDRKEALAYMESHFMAAIDYFRTKGIGVKVTPIGERPCMGSVDTASQKALCRTAAEIVSRHYGVTPKYQLASSDCNIPLSLGIPAVNMCCYNGSGAHTRGEFVEIDSLYPGLKVALEMVLHFL